MTLNTSQYERSHGKRPRGRGYWAWAFTPRPALDDLHWTDGTLTDVKKAAREEAKRRGLDVYEVYVQP